MSGKSGLGKRIKKLNLPRRKDRKQKRKELKVPAAIRAKRMHRINLKGK